MNRVLVLIVLVLASCKNQASNFGKIPGFKALLYPLLKIDSINEQSYPVEVQKLGVQKLYDKTRWYMYCMTFKKSFRFEPKAERIDTSLRGKITSDSNLTYGMLPLRLEDVILRNDSVEIHLEFYFNNVVVSERYIVSVPETYGCVFANKSDDEIVLVAGRGDARYWGRGCKNPPKDCISFESQIDTLGIKKYLIANRAKVDPWFYREAIKRGVIK